MDISRAERHNEIIELIESAMKYQAVTVNKTIAQLIEEENCLAVETYIKDNPLSLTQECVEGYGLRSFPLLYATQHDKIRIVKLLSEKLKCNINQHDQYGLFTQRQ